MKPKGIENINKKVIYPGDYFASNRKIVISTLLGSCVAACLYDSVNRVIGMNHFLLSSNLYHNNSSRFNTPSGRYGVQAMELLINKMLKLGADRDHLKAKAFGGATLKGFGKQSYNQNSIGNANIAFIREFLDVESIPLTAEDLGGSQGRTIYFVSTDFSVYVRKHDPIRLSDLVESEAAYKHRVKLREKTEKSDINLWQ